MTISTTTASQTFACDGTTTAFSFTFIGVSAGVLSLTQTATGGASVVIDPSAYTVALNAPAVGQLWGIGGTVTYPLAGTPIAAGNSLTLTRSLPNTQDTAVASNGAAFQAIEVGLDTLALQIQGLADGTAVALEAMFAALPTADPHIAGRLWWHSGILTKSSG